MNARLLPPYYAVGIVLNDNTCFENCPLRFARISTPCKVRFRSQGTIPRVSDPSKGLEISHFRALRTGPQKHKERNSKEEDVANIGKGQL